MTKDEALKKIATVNAMDFEYRAWARQALANDALEKKAENARELGLMPYDGGDYEPEIVQRVKRYVGKTMRTARNPCITARDCIELANWISEHTTQPQQNKFKPDWDEKLALTEEVIRLSKRIEELETQPSVSVEQEPVAFVKGCNRGQWEIFPAKAYQIFEREQPLYTTPPQRTWVGLTEEEIFSCENSVPDEAVTDRDWCIHFAQAIEAKLKEKNT